MDLSNRQFIVGLAISVLILVVDCQIIHSVDRLHAAVQELNDLPDLVRRYVEEERKRLDELEINIKYSRATGYENFTKSELERAMSHPVRLLRFIRDFSAEIDPIRTATTSKSASEDLKLSLEKLPSERDYEESVFALHRLQQVYLEDAEYTKPTLENPEDFLTADEVIDIAEIHLHHDMVDEAYDLFERSKELYEELGNKAKAMEAYTSLAHILFKQDNVPHALVANKELLSYYLSEDGDHNETISKLEEDQTKYIERIGGPDMAAYTIVNLPKRKIRQYSAENDHKVTEEDLEHKEHQSKLCRGEMDQVKEENTRGLKCYYYTNADHPLLMLSPGKLEELNSEIGLSFFHNLMTDGEIALLKVLATDRFVDSAIVRLGQDDEEQEKSAEITDKDNGFRSSNTGWVYDDEAEVIEALSRRIGAILNLDLATAEPFQVLSYGVGGFYLPHTDWWPEEEKLKVDEVFQGGVGNRIATWIFYLNDVDKGGATIFPQLNVTVWPEKGGAATWRNLYRNGTGNMKNLHAACPVLEGYKWASNKWFHTLENEFNWQCDLDSNV